MEHVDSTSGCNVRPRFVGGNPDALVAERLADGISPTGLPRGPWVFAHPEKHWDGFVNRKTF
jgi:hypothetical protein